MKSMKQLWGKYEKGTDRLVGYLSRGGRRWRPFPPKTEQEYFLIQSIMVKQNMERMYKSKYGWQTDHNYYYKAVDYPIHNPQPL